jgi:UDP-3-O-[3-hydroxymyristoyl] glucosamine N-acyltransferase
VIEMKLSELAERLDCRVEGDGNVEILRVASIGHAGPGDLTFLANPKYARQLIATGASAVILGPAPSVRRVPATCAVLRTGDPYTAYARALDLFAEPSRPAAGIHEFSVVAADAILGSDVSIGAFVTVGAGARIGARTLVHPNVTIGPGARIGDDCVLHPHVSIHERVTIGHRVILHDGVVVGSDGFGFAKQPDGTHLKIPHHAAVFIEDDVEIGANCAIDRPAIGETRISAGTKIDNLVHIAHGVNIGRRVLLAGQTGIAGSTTVADDVTIAGQSGVVGHVRIGTGAIIGAKSSVTRSLDAGAFVTGNPAIDHRDWRKASVIFRRLPALKKRVEELEQRLAELEEKVAECQIPPGTR